MSIKFDKTSEPIQNQRFRIDDIAKSGKNEIGSPIFLSTMQFFTFENNTLCEPFTGQTIPVIHAFVTDGTVVTNDPSLFNSNEGFDSDLEFLRLLEFNDCAYGSARCPIHPFICRLSGDATLVNGRSVLDSLGAGWFRSEHVASLDAASIHYPGYKPGSLNDEIHNDFQGQKMFCKRYEDDDEVIESGRSGPISPEEGTHGQLCRFVRNAQLWYVLLHSWVAFSTMPKQPWVVLFTVGVSPQNDALIGCVSHQSCHNLCD